MSYIDKEKMKYTIRMGNERNTLENTEKCIAEYLFFTIKCYIQDSIHRGQDYVAWVYHSSNSEGLCGWCVSKENFETSIKDSYISITDFLQMAIMQDGMNRWKRELSIPDMDYLKSIRYINVETIKKIVSDKVFELGVKNVTIIIKFDVDLRKKKTWYKKTDKKLYLAHACQLGYLIEW